MEAYKTTAEATLRLAEAMQRGRRVFLLGSMCAADMEQPKVAVQDCTDTPPPERLAQLE